MRALPPAVDSTIAAIGGTPMVRLRRLPREGSASVYVKLESFNPTGSYKDRMALAMIEAAERRGELRPGMTVVEYTGGSTGSSLAFVCAVKGYRFQVVSSDAFAHEKIDTMRAFGADVTLVPSENGKVTADLINRMIETARDLASSPDRYWTDQFNNRDMPAGFESLGDEILDQAGDPVDAFCAAVGTAGMATGVATVLRRRSPSTRIVVLEPAESPVLTGGRSGAHGVEGIGVGFRPPLLDDGLYDEARAIPEVLALDTARRLTREEGIFSGKSTGLNVAAALQVAEEIGADGTVVTVAVDSGLKYLSGDLYREDQP